MFGKSKTKLALAVCYRSLTATSQISLIREKEKESRKTDLTSIRCSEIGRGIPVVVLASELEAYTCLLSLL
jgi:hypothetical protein